jgi:membrane-bound lytic murein transglycosylase D
MVALAMLAVVAPQLGAQTLREAIPMKMRIPDQPRVKRYAAYYSSTAQRPWLREVLHCVGFYADYMLEQIEQRGLPTELIFLPVIESDYVSTATSPAGAVGLWQLMAMTARLNGLDTDGDVDERRDFWRATEAALNILQVNYEEFGSWELALAAYNAGFGRVRVTVRHGGVADFWELRERGYLPRETREYVPRYYGLLLALRSLPEEDWPRTDRRHRWRRLAVPEGIEVSRLGRLAGVPAGILERANAELSDGLTPAGRGQEGYRIKVPAAYYDRISAVLSPAADESRRHVRMPYVQPP